MTDAHEHALDRKDAADRARALADFERGRREGHREALALVTVKRDELAGAGQPVAAIDRVLAEVADVLEVTR
jgi:hypothetical protein